MKLKKSPAMEENLTYKEAVQEIEMIVKKIEEDDLDVDELSAAVKRATELLRWCKQKLKSTEDDLNQSLEELG